MAGLLSGGHILLIGVPGLAKTLLVRTLAAALGWKFRRIQFTPDLMPSDILGSDVLRVDPATGERSFAFRPGPVFTNLLLADEINRTPPKTQAALLEAMQELTVTAGGVAYPIEPPFLVVATQNPIEQEGTYPLPEAQLDRFLLAVTVGYPSAADEETIAAATSGPASPPPLPGADLRDLVGAARDVPSPPHVTRYAVSIVRATRPDDPTAPAPVRESVRWGAGPRASHHLLLAAKAGALLAGRFAVTRDDVLAMVKPVLRHRLVLRLSAQAGGVRSDEVLDAVVATVPLT
jgi:MoxR-like ATPase